ncbi:YlbF family regulator [Bacillus kwashiorkori]|uniref:YlbF family regulator n=1 Tax=Bacillus kwashiorkori TaxID=1522318 RepID=UPI000785DCD4|nr:YlbF family regulator [Bacillus kwashiorkori]
MAENIMDSALVLEKAVRESDEFTQLKARYQQLYADDSARQMFDNFRNVQMKLEEKRMMGEPIPDDEVQYAQQLVAVIQQNEKIVALMEAEQRMSMVIGEINKVVMKPLEELYNNMK